MKTIKYFIIAGFICLTLAFSGRDSSQRIILQPENNNVTTEIISQSAKIISRRLEICGIKANVSVTDDNKQIGVQFTNNIDVSEITDLLTKKGEIGFYETLTLNEIKELLKSKNSQITFRGDPKIDSDARLVCSGSPDRTDKGKVQNSLKSINLSPEYKLLWSKANKESEVCLYAIKATPEDGLFIKKSGIESVRSLNKGSDGLTVEINFKPDVVRTWSLMTSKSIGKPIAIVIDSTVFYNPVVRDIMDKGLCEISGNLSQKEADYFLALVNTDTLPVSFVIK